MKLNWKKIWKHFEKWYENVELTDRCETCGQRRSGAAVQGSRASA